nr:BMP family ABC transporter substrate-binding protein [Ardenticatenales bacterium]
MQRLWRLLVALSLLMALLVACGGGSQSTTGTSSPNVERAAGEPLKIAFIYNGPIGDLGWNWAHDQGRLAISEEFRDRVLMTSVESVSEEQATQVIRDYAQQGYHLIFTPASGFIDPTIEVAKEFPNTWFIHASGSKTAPNVSTVFGRMEIPRYLSGIVAGSATES